MYAFGILRWLCRAKQYRFFNKNSNLYVGGGVLDDPFNFAEISDGQPMVAPMKFTFKLKKSAARDTLAAEVYNWRILMKKDVIILLYVLNLTYRSNG